MVTPERRGPHPSLPTFRTKTFAALVPFDPTLDRDFGSGDILWAWVRAYCGKVARGELLLTASVSRAQDGAVVWTASESKSAGASGVKDGAEYAVPLPLNTLAPGAYRLRVAAEYQGGRPEAREVDFTVHDGTETTAATPLQASASAWASSPAEVSALLDAAAGYARDYFERLSSVVGEEVYEQAVEADSLEPFSQAKRTTRSDFLLVRVPGQQGLTPFRDVFEVDGRAVRDRNDRLEKLFLRDPVLALDTARRVLNDGARYNVGRVYRNINHPVLPLMFLLPENRGRFAYAVQGEERLDGKRALRVNYVETARPTFISSGRAEDPDRPASGSLSIEPDSGRVLITKLRIGDRAFAMEATVVYRHSPELGMLVPFEMREFYRQWLDSAKSRSERITCRATYQRFRRFGVSTEERIGIPKDR